MFSYVPLRITSNDLSNNDNLLSSEDSNNDDSIK